MLKGTSNSTRTSAFTRTARKLALVGLIAGMSASLVGCDAINSVISSSSTSGGTNAVGSGEKIDTGTGSYEKLTVPKDSALYKVDEEAANAANIAFENDVVAAGQKLAIDFVLTETLDSSALEGGDAGYQSWVETTAPKYFSERAIRTFPPVEKANGILFGNIGGSASLPKLINDGGPRLKNATAKVTSYAHESITDNPGSAIKYTVEFSGDYRVSDSAAAEFSAFHSGTTPEQFLASDSATEAVKDGVGENVHRTTGTADIIISFSGVHEYELSALKILGYKMKADFDYSSYSKG